MAKEDIKPQTPQQPIDNGVVMRKYIIHRFQKKTAKNPTGRKLMTVTFAPSIEAAGEIARQMIELTDGPAFEITPV